MNYRCYHITKQWTTFTKIGSGAKWWLDIYHWGAGLAVTGRIRDIGQKALQPSFRTVSSSSHFTSTFPSFSHSSRKPLLQTQCNDVTMGKLDGTIIICINNNAIIKNNNYRRLQDLILLFKIPMGIRKNFFEIWAQAGVKIRQPWRRQ